MKAIKRRVADGDIRDLIWKFLRAGVIYKGEFAETLTGTPQGGIVSPLLANIYLHDLGACPRKKSLKNNAFKLRRDDFKISHFSETRVLTGGQNFCTFLKNL